MVFCFLFVAELIEDACYGGFVDINCVDRRILVLQEIYGRHPDEHCEPSASGRDCR